MNAPGGREARLLRNTGYLLAAFLLQKPLSFLYFNFLAGALGVSLLGAYTKYHDIIPIAIIAIDFSLSAVLTREIAKTPERASTLLGNVLAIKLALSLVAFATAGAVLAFGHLPPLSQAILFLVAVTVALDTFTLTFFSVFRGMQNMRYESWGVLATQVVTVVLGFVLLKLGYGLTAAFWAIVAGSAFNFVLASTFLVRRAGVIPRPQWHWPTVRSLLAIALPFAATAALVKLFIYTDRYILLAASHGQNFPLGVYITAHKWAYTFEFLPSALAAALLPAMSAAFVQSKERLMYLFERSLHYLVTLAAPILVGLFVLGDRILLQFLPDEFQASTGPLRILVFAIPAIFINYAIGTLLNATNRQAWNTLSVAIALVVNVVLNVLLVRSLSYTGTAIATLVSNIVLVALGLTWIHRFLKIPWRSVSGNAVRALIAAAAMGLVLAISRSLLPLPALAVLGAAIYALAVAVLGGVTREDVRAVVSALKGRGFGAS